MRALVVREWTKFDNLRIEDDWPEPVAVPGMVKIRTQAAGMNFAMSLRVEGKYQVKPPLPHVPGIENAGYVSAVGEGVTKFRVGDRVVCHVNFGAYAEECLAPEYRTYALPDGVPFHKAIGLPTSAITSYAALVWPQWAHLQSGETLLVHGAAGGVGLAAIDIAGILGARVIATCGSEDKARVCRDHGADEVINYRVENFRDRVMALTGGEGVNVVYDPVGGDVFMQSLRCMAPEGRIVPIGFAGGIVPQIPANILLVKNLKVLALNYGYYCGQWGSDPKRHKDMGKVYEPLVRGSMDRMFGWIGEGRMRPEISHVFPFDRCKEAMAVVLGRDAIGRVAVVFDEEARRLGL
jgi:NADPH2:quinone reductase